MFQSACVCKPEQIKVHTPEIGGHSATAASPGKGQHLCLDGVLGSTVSPKKYKVNTSPAGSQRLEPVFVSVVLLLLARS